MSEIVENVEKTTVKPKRSVREFLNQYRSLGLPNAKRFRRRSRLQQAAWDAQVNQAYVRALVHQLQACRTAFDKLKAEENWAVRGDDVVWTGEGDPLEIIKAAEDAK